MLRKVLISHHSLKFYEIHMILARCLNSVREGGFAMYPHFLAWEVITSLSLAIKNYEVIMHINKNEITLSNLKIKILFAIIDDILTFLELKIARLGSTLQNLTKLQS